MDGLAIAASLSEAQLAITGGLIRTIYQPQAGTFVFHLFAGKDLRLLVSPREAAIHLTQLDLAYPKTPSPFVMLLRKYLRGGKITGMQQPGRERVVRLEVDRRDGEGIKRFTVVVELLGLRGNLILLKGDKVVAAWRSDPRAVAASPYQPLPSQEKLDPATITTADLTEILQAGDRERALVRRIDGIGRQTARAILARAQRNLGSAPLEEKVLQELSFVLSHAEKPQAEYDVAAQQASFFPLCPPGEPCKSFAAALDREVAERHEAAQIGEERDALRAGLTRAIRKREQTLIRLQEWIAKADSADLLTRCADLILIHNRELSRGMSEATLTDPESGEPVQISLNPNITPVENAQTIYKRAKRLRRGRPIVERRLKRLEQELAKLKTELASLTQGETPSEEAIALFSSAIFSRGAPTPQTAPRVFQIAGHTVEVGKDAAQNDALLRKARPDDLWLHAKGVSGSHVIVHRQGRADIPNAVIEAAARLAARYSKAKAERRVVVSTALVKHVRKPKGSPPGLVILSQEDTLTVEPLGKGN